MQNSIAPPVTESLQELYSIVICNCLVKALFSKVCPLAFLLPLEKYMNLYVHLIRLKKTGLYFLSMLFLYWNTRFSSKGQKLFSVLKQGSLFCEPIYKNNTTYELPLSPQIFVPNEEYCFFDVWSAVFR